MILRIQGENDFYNLAVPTKGENTLVLDEGADQLSSNVCDVKYTSVNERKSNKRLILNNPVYKTQHSFGGVQGSAIAQRSSRRN